MKKKLFLFLISLSTVTGVALTVYVQMAPPPPPNLDPGSGPGGTGGGTGGSGGTGGTPGAGAVVPIDGGISFLIAAGAGLGAVRLRRKKNAAEATDHA